MTTFPVGGGTITTTQPDNSTDDTGTGGGFLLQPNTVTDGDTVTVSGVFISNSSGAENGNALNFGYGLPTSGSYLVSVNNSTLQSTAGAAALLALSSGTGTVTYDSTGGPANTLNGSIGVTVGGQTGNVNAVIKTGADIITTSGFTGEILYAVATGTGSVSIDSAGATLTGGGLYGISANAGSGGITIGGLNGGFASSVTVTNGYGIYTGGTGNANITLASSGSITAREGMRLNGQQITIDSYGSIAGSVQAINANNAQSLTLTLRAGSVTSGNVLTTVGDDTVNVYTGADITNASFQGVGGSDKIYLRGTGSSALDLFKVQMGPLFKVDSGTWTLSGMNGRGLDIAAGTIITNGDVNIGELSGSGGTLTIGSGTLTVAALSTKTVATNINGTGGLLKNGASGNGVLILTGNNTYSGGTTVDDGLINFSNLSNLGSGNITLSRGGLQWAAGNTIDISPRLNPFANATFDTNGNDVLFSAALSGSNPNGSFLTKTGTGTLTLTGVQSYATGTIIEGGTLRLAANAHLATSAFMVINGGTFDVNGNSQLIDYLSGNGSIALGAGNLAINQTLGGTFAGAITGTGSVTLNTGRLFLTGDSTYSGGTTIVGGALVIGANSTTGSITGNVSIGNAGYLMFQRSNTVTFNGAISGSGQVVQNGTGTLILGGNSSFTGGTTVNFGAKLLVDGAIASSAVTVASGATLGGSGTVGATNIQSGGKLTPGDGLGTLQVNGNLTLASGATYAEDVSPATADEIIVAGNASIAGNLTASLAGGSYGHQAYTILHSTGPLSGTFASISVTGLPAGLIAGLAYGAHDVTLTTDHVPVAATANITAAQGQSLALSSLLSVSDADGDMMTRYQLWDSTRDCNSGHFVVNGVAQAAGTVIDVTAAQLAQASFVAGSVGDSLQIRAFDGYAWSAADNASWSPFTLSIRSNNPPQVTTTTQRLAAGQSVALSSLAMVSDADGDTITRYQLWDSTRDPNSGHWMVNGVAQTAGTVIDVSAPQLAQTSFLTGTVNDNLQIRAFDGIDWSAPDSGSWAPFIIGPLVNNAPVVQTGNRIIARGVTTALSSLITVSDADGDAMTEYQLWDASRDPDSGYFVVNGQVQAAGTVIDISAAQLAQTSFVTGSVGDNLQVRAFDGISWSAPDTAGWSPFSVSVPDAAPVVSTNDVTRAHLQSYALSSLFSVTDADGDTMTRYQLWDSTRDPNSGSWVVNGQAQAAGTVIDITAAQLAQTSFLTGAAGIVDGLQIRAFDGIAWSAADNAAWAPFHVAAT